VHRDPSLYGAPERFEPERWLDGRTQALARFAYFPFGGGPRVCIGSHFAMLEISILLAILVRELDLDVPAGYQPELAPVVTLRPRNGVPVRVTRVS
jgi:cytochrome P450